MEDGAGILTTGFRQSRGGRMDLRQVWRVQAADDKVRGVNMWYNETELRDACKCVTRDVQEIDVSDWRYAAKVMLGFIDLINSISDGWFTWHYGTRCSEELQGLIMDSRFFCRRQPVSNADITKACRKIFKFLRRCRQTKDLPAVADFLENVNES